MKTNMIITTDDGIEIIENVTVEVVDNTKLTLRDVKDSIIDGSKELYSDLTKAGKLLKIGVVGYGYVYARTMLAELHATSEVINKMADTATEMYL